MADITANVDAWSSTEASNQPQGTTTIGTGLDDNLRAVQAGIKLMQERSPFGGALIINGKITRTVGASALTIALKGLDGNDPSATNKVYVLMPTVTSNLVDGGYAMRAVTAALSLVISSGSTLGHTSAVASPVYIYAIDNAGTIELAASNKFFGGAAVVSTTAEGGGGGADTGTTLYSTTARSNVACACLQRWKSTQTTAGTWAATTGDVQLFPFPYKTPAVQAFTNSGANTYTKPWDLLSAKVTVVAGGGAGGGSTATNAGEASVGAGGGAGGSSIKTIAAASIGATETATVGAGGTGVSGSTGNTGGTSSFGAHCSSTGGSGGGVSANAANGTVAGSSGGSGSSGDVNITGGSSHGGVASGATFGALSGAGGASMFGGGGGSQITTGGGLAGAAYGSGGSGAATGPSGAAQTGGAGKAGIVIVEEFF